MTRLRIGGVCLVALWFGIAAANEAPTARSDGATATGRGGMVVSVSRTASQVGRSILERGGNAVDAAVATAFALAVAWPEAGNLGGGGFMLIYPRNHTAPIVVDYRETAPAAATRDMFAAKGSPSAYALVGVPGTVRGLALAHHRAGRLPWKDLLLPAIALAGDGVAVDESLARSLNRGLARSLKFPEFRRVFGKAGSNWKAGDPLVQPDLADTLRLLADGGPDAFYQGPIAAKIVAEMQQGGGLITAADLAGYAAKERAAVHGTYRGFDIYAPPPPSSGGICLVEMLNILENFPLQRQGRWSPATLQQMTEAMRRAYCDRARYLGDSDFVSIPAQLTDKAYARKLADSIAPGKATASSDLAPELSIVEENDHTTHFSVIDRDGLAVSNTYTLEDSFGGKIVVRGAGFLLNNEMGDFNPRPGITSRSGLIGTPANQVAPHKRMLSSMCPTIVAKDGRALLVTGSPGGRTIINTVLCVAVNVLDFDMKLRDAVDAPRMHHAWLPDRLSVEPGLIKRHADALQSLRERGQSISEHGQTQGDAHSIRIGPDGYLGVADQRIGGWAAGY